jgi:hypothetical protein
MTHDFDFAFCLYFCLGLGLLFLKRAFCFQRKPSAFVFQPLDLPLLLPFVFQESRQPFVLAFI